MEARPRKYETVEQGHGHTCLRRGRKNRQHVVSGRTVDVERVIDPHVSGREHVGRVTLAEADVTKEALVQDRVEDGTVVVATLSMASDGRAGRRGAVRGSG